MPSILTDGHRLARALRVTILPGDMGRGVQAVVLIASGFRGVVISSGLEVAERQVVLAHVLEEVASSRAGPWVVTA